MHQVSTSFVARSHSVHRLGCVVCLANISLIVPDFNPEPLSAEVVGVGADGETTYLLYPGQPTGTWISQPAAFIGTGSCSVIVTFHNF